MKNIIFADYMYQYFAENWDTQKTTLTEWINKAEFKRDTDQVFLSDKKDLNKNYQSKFVELFRNELEKFEHDIGREVKLKDAWLVRYERGDWHPPHNHGSMGYSGILFIEFDEDHHRPPYFIDPNNDRFTDRTNYIIPKILEGGIVISRSNILHFTYPNLSDKERIILGFDLEVI